MLSEKSSKRINKIKQELEKENKKPPILIVAQKEKEPEKNKQKESKNLLTIKTEEVEKVMLKGEIHIEEKENNKFNKKLKEKNEKQMMEEIPKKIIKEEDKKQLIVKPRETYLQEKISKMNLDNNLISNIKKEMGNKIKNIIKEEGVLIGKKNENLKKIFETSDKAKNGNENFENKKKYKEIKAMADKLNGLKYTLKQIEDNEEFIKNNNESNLIMNSIESNNENMDLDKTQSLLKLRQKKEQIREKIKEINYKLKNLFDSDKIRNNSYKQRIQDFLTNFERDKEIIEIRAQKYIKESKERNQRKQNDIIRIMEKRKKEIEEKEEETKNQNQEIKKKFKEKEKEIEQKQYKFNEEIFLRYKPYINQKPDKTKKQYLYSKRYESFRKNEEKYFQKKEKKDIYNLNEIEKFAQEFDSKIERRKNIQEQKSMELWQKWAENKEKLPKNNHYYSVELANKQKILEEEKKNETKKKIIKEYSEKVRENFSPEIDINKRMNLRNLIRAMEDPKREAKKYTLIKQKRNRIIMKKRDNTKPSKYNWVLKLDLDLDKEINFVKKPKKINLAPITRTTTELPNKKPNYLEDLINNKKATTRINSSTFSEKYISDKKSEKFDENYKNKILDKINIAKNRVEYMEQKAKTKEQLLKINGGIENNPQLGKQVSDMYIDSIEEKLNYLKKLNEI